MVKCLWRLTERNRENLTFKYMIVKKKTTMKVQWYDLCKLWKHYVICWYHINIWTEFIIIYQFNHWKLIYGLANTVTIKFIILMFALHVKREWKTDYHFIVIAGNQKNRWTPFELQMRNQFLHRHDPLSPGPSSHFEFVNRYW